MREGDIDIVELIINNMPTETETQRRIKLYMECHKSNCNNFVYSKYQQETIMLNNVFKSLRADLGREILEILNR